MTAPHHHPAPDMLLDYATGALSEAESLLIAAHLTLCPACRIATAELDAVGGALLETLAKGDDGGESGAGFTALAARLDEASTHQPLPPQHNAAAAILPAPVRHYVGGDLAAARWQWRLPGLHEAKLPITGPFAAHLLRVAPGRAMPRHTHDSRELTLVLQGGFHDGFGHFQRGDVADANAQVDHRPVADLSLACVCLVVTDAPPRLTGWLGRLLNPLLRHS
jgi:putative transcriptional regulator